jgi:hypothetical protein
MEESLKTVSSMVASLATMERRELPGWIANDMADGMIKAFNCAIALENLVCDSPKRCRQSSR